MFRSIQWRITIWFVLLVVAGMIALGACLTVSVRSSQLGSLSAQLENEAAIIAAKLRFRAVLMTAISFILGVMPLVLAIGAGAASRRSLGTAVFGGMLIAGIVGTILIPSFYVIIQYLIEFFGKKRNN